MTQALAALAALCLCLSGGEAQPTGCSFGTHYCPEGFYCEPDLLYCRKCLRCEDLKRESLPSQSSCVKSVSDCGPCYKGLVIDHRGDVNSACVPRGENGAGAGETEGFPVYGWVLVTLLCLLLLLLFGGIVWYVLKHPDTLKILASTSTSMQSRCERSVVPASAPEHPPPYNALYTAVQPAAPAHSPAPAPSHAPAHAPAHATAHDNEYQPTDEECSSPFIKQSSPEREWCLRGAQGGAGGGAAREAAGSQAARIYNNPAYVRRAPLPHGYENGGEGAKGPAEADLDEDTMESTWTPAQPSPAPHTDDSSSSSSSAMSGAGLGAVAGVSGGGGGGGAADSSAAASLPALLAAAKGTALIRTPYTDTALQPYVRQDPNNNGNRGNGEPSFESGSGGAQHGSSFIINVVQTINAVQQRGDGAH